MSTPKQPPSNGSPPPTNGKPAEKPAIPTINGNVEVVGGNGKLLGGITGKGFRPGQSGNPSGKNAKHQTQFGELLRDWLSKKEWVKDLQTGKRKGRAKEMRLMTIVKQLAAEKPEVLLHYAFGKPVEMHQVEAAEGTDIEFIVRVHGKDIP